MCSTLQQSESFTSISSHHFLFIYLLCCLVFLMFFFFFLIFGRRKLFEKESFLFLPPWYFLLIFGRTAPFSPALKCNRKKIKAENWKKNQKQKEKSKKAARILLADGKLLAFLYHFLAIYLVNYVCLKFYYFFIYYYYNPRTNNRSLILFR